MKIVFVVAIDIFDLKLRIEIIKFVFHDNSCILFDREFSRHIQTGKGMELGLA